MPTYSLRACFANAEEMDNYFKNQDQEKERRRENMGAEWTRQSNDFNNNMNDMHDLFRIDNM